jgi:predicted helicase
LAPLYTFESDLLSRGKPERRANLSPNFIAALQAALGAEPKPEEVFHYLLAVFHSEKYRERYGELIKQDFPRVPLTNKKTLFAGLVNLGREIASLHMMESGLKHTGSSPVGMVGAQVEKADYDEATKIIWIDKRKTKGLKGVESEVWEFCVGGYQVCEKWLKDRKGESLSKSDVEHYQLVVATLAALSKQMKDVDALISKHGGWPGAFATKASAS